MNFRLCIPILLTAFTALTACGSDASKNAETPGGGSLPLPGGGSSGTLVLAADLNGRYVQSIRIEDGDFSANSGGQEVTLGFAADGMANVKQFEFRLSINPVNAIDFAGSAFAATQPFLQPPPAGIEQMDDGQWRIAGAIFGDSKEGNNRLGMLTLKTADGFDAQNEVQIRVTFFSVGPSFSDRDDYTADDLNMGVTINQR